MRFPVSGVGSYCVISLFRTRIRLERYFRVNSNSFPADKYLHRNSELCVISRHISSESLNSYSSRLFSYVSESRISELTRDVFVNIHDFTGLPWWCTIVVSATMLKMWSLPWMIYQNKLTHRLTLIDGELRKQSEKVKREMFLQKQQHLWTPEYTFRMFKIKMYKERKSLIQKNNCHPFKIILCSYFEAPVWIFMSITWRTMTYGFSDDISASKVLIKQMMVEGPFWCNDLTISDPTYMLPLLTLLGNLALMELLRTNGKLLKREYGRFHKILAYVSRTFAVLAALLCSVLPSAVGTFWVSSTLMSFVRELLLISPKFRKIFGLPHLNYSYAEVFSDLKNKFFNIFKVVKWKDKKPVPD